MIKTILLALLVFTSTAFCDEVNLTKINTVVFRGTVSGSSIMKAQTELMELSKLRGKKNYPIYLVLDCPGGGIMEGDAFIQYAKTVPNVETITFFAASMCSGFVEALPGKLHIIESGVIMFHRAHAQVEGYLNEGELEEQVRFIKNIVTAFETRNSTRMQMTLPAYKARVATEWWLYGQEAVTDKAVDVVSNVTCSQSLVDKEETASVRTMFGEVDVTYSGCPLFRLPIK